jgi:hypothetical protein
MSLLTVLSRQGLLRGQGDSGSARQACMPKDVPLLGAFDEQASSALGEACQ